MAVDDVLFLWTTNLFKSNVILVEEVKLLLCKY